MPAKPPFWTVDDPTRQKLEALLKRVDRQEREIKYLKTMVKRRWRDGETAGLEVAMMYLPPQDLDNYLFPVRYLGRESCYGYKCKYEEAGRRGYYGEDTTEHEICNPLGVSCLMPGDLVLCWRNIHAKWTIQDGVYSTSVAWEPFPGQGLIRPARTYKDIPARTAVEGDGIWFTTPTGEQDILELNAEKAEALINHNWCHSKSDIEATEDEPKQLMLAYISQNSAGYEWMVIDRQCNVDIT